MGHSTFQAEAERRKALLENGLPDFKLQLANDRWMGAVSGGNLLRSSCHHKRNGACGGCYARLTVLIDAIKAEPSKALEIIAALEAEMQAEAGR